MGTGAGRLHTVFVSNRNVVECITVIKNRDYQQTTWYNIYIIIYIISQNVNFLLVEFVTLVLHLNANVFLQDSNGFFWFYK